MATEMVRDTSSMSIASELRDPLNFEIVVFTAYLLQLLPLLLGATERDLNRMFQSTEYQEIISKWANDVTAPAVYITKMRVEVELDAPELNTYHVSSNVKHDNRNVVTLSLIKHSTLIDTTLAISDQLHFLNLFGPAAGRSIVGATAGSGVYEGLHRLVHLGITPAFDAFIESTNKKDVTKRREDLKDDSKMGIPMTKKKFAELELSLLHLQQNVEIPEIILNIHPAVQAAISTAKEQGITPTVALINSTLLTDTTFLNRLQSDVNNWVKEIRTVTNLNRDVSSGTASQEINFWLSMERALDGIEEQLKNDSVVLSLEILRSAKRFHATTTFTADTGLKEAMETVHKYNVLMKDFPLDELLAATDLTRVQESIQSVFNHFIKKMKISPYPVRRALDLVSAISRALNDQLLKVLGVSNIMSLEYSTFATAMQGCSTIYSIWDECVKEFTNIARDITRKRGEKFISMKIDIFHNKLQSRLEYLNNFRDQHHQLQSKVSSLSAKGVGEGALGIDMNREVRQAYDSVKDVEVLEVGAAGTEVWVQAEAVYIEKVARVENQIISRLREQLGAARNANEMFRVFSKFKALLARQKIKGAVVEYQDQLLESVKTDINLLHAKYTEGYHNSEAYRISQLRDYPPVSGAIIWAQQIESQLEMYMKRVEAVLGEGWRGYAEGGKLCDSSEKFKVKLETKEVFNAWIAETSKRKFGIVGPIFNITKNRSQGGALQLVINFDSQTIALFKEVRNLIWRGFAVPNSILSISKDAKKVYPYAVNSIETVRTYTQTVAKVNANPGIVPLISDLHVKVQMQIKKCMPIRWEQFTGIYDPRKPEATASRSIALVSDLAKAVSAFQDTTDSLIDTYSEIMVTIERLATCPYTSSDFSTLLGSIQTIIDNFNLIGFSNLSSWVAELDKQIEAVLVIRLRSAMELWCVEFAKDGETTTEPKRIVTETEGMVFKTLLHEIRIKNQVIYLEPPIEQARGCWYQQLHSSLAVICGLKRVQAARYENSMRVRKPLLVEDRDYTALLDQFVDGTLTRPLALIENKLDQITAYVGKWLQFQSLWDLEAEYVYNRLGDSLSSWQQLLMEIQKTRATFDNSENEKSFGVAIINYDQVQSKVTAKYDTWQREILGRFGSKLSDKMKETYETILESRHKLESHSIDASTTNATVDFIELVQTLNRNVKKWSPEIQLFGYGQTTLERQRYQFPINWLTVERIESEWSTFNVILGRRNASIQESLASLQTKILAEDQVIQNRIEEIVENWNLNKPMKGDVKPEAAMKTVVTFESKVHQLKQEADAISRAKEALNLELVHDTRLTPVIEEIKDIKEVWTVLDGVWKQIGELKETLWSIVQSRKLRTQLDDISKGLQSMTARLRNYAAFVYVGGVIKDYLKSNLLVGDLKSEALRERHWRQLFKVIRVDYTYTASSLTLGAVWNLDLQKNQKPIQEVILQAQGEMALEEFIKQVKETWTGYSLDLVNYQTKTRLIRGWEDLFTKCSENLSSLSAMKLSPYYKVFEEEASSWEDKLNRVHVLFDVWIDVQRQWVYLEGIFSGSADIKHLLPVESQRFNNINAEFLNVMKKVAKSPLILDVLNIQGVQKSLERLADLLSKIQKALGEYLERERASFPRFYFVGDEDLLEIIGNSKDILRIGKFLKKMFAGLASISLDKDLTQIQGMASREGEMVTFSNPIILKDYAKINDWLTKLELEMKVSLAQLLATAFLDLQQFYNAVEGLDSSKFLSWIQLYPAQLVVLAVQIGWTSLVEGALASNKSLEGPLSIVLRGLELLADAVLSDLEPIQRRKCEHLITELVHERDVIRSLIQQNVDSNTDFNWLYQMRFYLDSSILNPLDQLQVRMASANFSYGYEYLGVPDRLVQTPLTDRCYLTLTQALHSRLGGSPFGPAGTGKTESVKALGVQLGRFVLVFCCDETFDFQAMGRIFVGLCQVGAWGCFDEFNRLEERILSAVSQQIQSIQLGLSARVTNPEAKIELVGRQLRISQDTGIFITMNPGYAGRSNLPDNLKKLFRSIAMTRPDRELIAQVMLFSQGFRTAETLASKIVPFFNLCSEQLSSQPHYDFGLRALKSVLVSAGHLKRERLQLEIIPGTVIESVEISEQEILIQSVTETIVPKLVANDVPLLTSLLSDVFPGINYVPVNLDELRKHIIDVSVERQLVPDAIWLQKVIQLYQIQNIQHGLMMVGPSATGKTTAWSVLLTALERLSGIEGVSYVIDPKAISKEALYGTLDSTTREWNDGLFTHILRKIVDDVRSESMKRHWIIFDGDVDPEWVENLNSVLDDNKLLTLPNGERLNLPSNVRIMFEVESLKYATLATVSRCGMVWFSEDAISPSMLYKNYLQTITALPLDATDDDLSIEVGSDKVSTNLAIQRTVATRVEQYFEDGGLIPQALEFAAGQDHIMDFTIIRAVTTLFSLLNKTIRNVVEFNTQHADFPMPFEKIESYVTKRLLVAIVWAFTGDSKLETRAVMGDFLRDHSGIDLPPLTAGASLIDYDVAVSTGDWISWQSSVPTIEIETHTVLSADVVIPTMDTARHEEVLYSWLSEHRPLLLCGPPGSGKTMTLFSALRKLPDLEVIGLNFSSATTPELILKTFEQHCEYRKTPSGVILSPVQIGKWIVLFCDEINLPATDTYGTQKVISFLRQLVEHGGYWRVSDKSWVKLERIQFVGACNPPTDPGRVALSHRFLRHAPLVMVDYPGETSLNQIYGTFNRAVLKVVPSLRDFSRPLTSAMVEFYLTSQKRFTTDIQAHYVYSPRELTRWMRGIYEAIKPLDNLAVEGLVRIWAHEALRLFQDRLVTEEERKVTDEMIDEVALKHFPAIDPIEALARPILYSNWTSKDYLPVGREELRDFTKARLRTFYEEELDVPLVLFDDVLEHVLRIDRVFKQVQGHLLLIGVSGSGKTTLSRFVAWMNGLSVFQIKVHNKYSAEDFDDDLRAVLRRAGCKGEKIAFILDESNVLDSGFLERMNTLLANAEVPGLFEGDEHAALMTACKEGAQRDGLMLDSQEELYRWFTQQVSRNLHVVFTMNPPSGGLASRAATSPALFNRCVLDWFGDWSDQAFYQVGMEFTNSLDLDTANYIPPSNFPVSFRQLSLPPSHRSAVINGLVNVHMSMYETNAKLARRQGRTNFVTPRHYLDFINQYVKIFNEKRDELEEQQRHLNVGLEKLRTTVIQVEELRVSLASKGIELDAKNAEANEKLIRMVQDQQIAEQKKLDSIKIQADLETQKVIIEARSAIVIADLAAAAPAVEDAQAAVRNIKKQQLTEVRSMANPPEAVKLAMESVCTILGNKIESWKTVQSIIRQEGFIASIVNFDTQSMSSALRDKMQQEYLSLPNFNFENVNRASKACGPLCIWVIAQVNYSNILERIGPLREEVEQLEREAGETEDKATHMITMVAELEARIAQFKGEYALLISETQAIKAEVERVEKRVTRSITLLESLGSERIRWEAGSKTFESQMSTVAGDVLLSAAFLAYSGYFDQQYRESMWQSWSDHLSDAGIQFKPELSLSEYLSTAEDRLEWQSKSLPADDLCTENAIMLERFDRYPLIIDPSGQATAFLLNKYKQKKISVTSFLDEAFLKNLESALRFGTPLLVQDVENLDPILNAVLNKELRRAGGRVLIRLGNQDIDFSPAFTMFLTTRDPSVDFPADLISRVTMVNFSITRASLQAQSLSQVLRVERPDTDRKRSDLLRLQGEFRARLHVLEKSLLSALNESHGNILDDDKVIETLETLKREAAEITQKVEETDSVMAEVEQVTSEYLPLAQACSSIFFVLDELHLLNHFYQFSLRFFLDIFDFVLLHNPSLLGVTNSTTRLSILLEDLFLHVFKRTSRALLHSDHLTLAMLLAQVKLRAGIDEVEYNFLLEGGEIAGTKAESNLRILDLNQNNRLEAFKRLECFSTLEAHIQGHPDEWSRFLTSKCPESELPPIWTEISPGSLALRTVLVIRCLRPDRLLPAVGGFVNFAFGRDLLSESTYELSKMVANEVTANSPIALCSVPGYDASYRVDALVAATNSKCTSVAMGSQEGETLADQAIAAAARTGNWVLLKNVHLAPSWLSQLEKRLQSLKTLPNFRLFLTMETNPSIPINILRQSRVLLNEPPPGIRANMLESLKSISPARIASGPMEKTRIYFLLAWFHALVQERLRYVPLGWSKPYEFNDSDQEAALGTIDSWLIIAARGRSNIDPASIPWDAIRSLMRESIYGGKIDTEVDQILLDSFVGNLFSARSYDIDFYLVPKSQGEVGLLMPDATKIDEFITWTKNLPESEPPSYLSLPATAETIISVAQGSALLARLLRMRALDDDMETVSVEIKGSGADLPLYMRLLGKSCSEWLNLLPEAVPALTNEGRDSLSRFFEREVEVARATLAIVRSDLQKLKLVCEGKLKQTNSSRNLLSDLNKAMVPSHWQTYQCQPLSVGIWIQQFAQRVQMERIVGKPVHLGLLFNSGGFITATRQLVAHTAGISLELLHLSVGLEKLSSDANSFNVQGLSLVGATWLHDRLVLNDGSTTQLGISSISWSKISTEIPRAVRLPCWLDSTRSELLLTVQVDGGEVSAVDLVTRGLAIVL